MANMKAYLAEKYMSGPKADAILTKLGPKKKKKRKHTDDAPTASGSFIRDDDESGWGNTNQEEAEADDVSEAVVASDRDFKKRKVAGGESTAGWTTVKEGIKQESPPPDEKPLVVDEVTPFTGGLVSAKQLKKVLPHSSTAAPDLTAEEVAMAQETVYRDASGRKIDTKAAKAEAARLKREKEEKEAQKMEWGKGLVQRQAKEKEREDLEKLRTKAFARHADDADLNEDLKRKELWNDPAAAFISKRKPKGPRRPEYTGPTPPPNRFGIKPGYRWDGVDRGNGFEKKLFQTKNEFKRKGLESYQWGTDDM